MQNHRIYSQEDKKIIAISSINMCNSDLCAVYGIKIDQLLDILDEYKDLLKNKREEYIKNANKSTYCSLEECISAFSMYMDAVADYKSSREQWIDIHGEKSMYTTKKQEISSRDIILLRDEIEKRLEIYKNKASSYIKANGEEGSATRRLFLQEGIDSEKTYRDTIEKLLE